MKKTKNFEIGRICEKNVGKEKGRICVIVEEAEKDMVIIDGDVKRRRCNISHLNLLEKTIKIKKGEKTEEIKKALEKEGFSIVKKAKLKERLRRKREEKRESEKEIKKGKKK